MIIKFHKRSFALGVAIIIAIATLFSTYDASKLRHEKWALMEDMMSMDLGLSDPPQLSELGSYLFHNSFRALTNIITGFPDRPKINRIDIDIKMLEFNKILADRQRGIDDNVSYYRQKVNAKIRHRSSVYKAKIRLKGTSLDHWRAKTRMSLRINLRGNKTINGFKKFSLHKPGSRQYPYDNIFQKLMRQLGNLAAVHKSVHVFVNGKNWGIMDMQEHVSKEMLEKQRVKNSIVVYLGSRYLARYQRKASEVYKNYHLNNGHLIIDVFSSKKYLKDLVHRKYLSYLIEESVKANRENIIDKQAFFKTILAYMVWNNEHGLNYQNCRFYFNPYILKLQPVTNDQAKFLSLQDRRTLLPELFLDVAKAKDLVEQYNQPNQSTILSEENINKIIADVQRNFPNDAPIDASPLINHIRLLKADPDKFINDFIDKMPRENTSFFLRSATPQPSSTQVMSDNVAKDIPIHITVHHFDDGTLRITNLLDVKLDLIEVIFENRKLEIDATEVPSYTSRDGVLVIDTNYKGIMDGQFSVVTRLLGHERTHTSEHTLLKDTYNPLQENTTPLPSFVEPINGGYRIKSGDWIVTHPLVIDGPLTLDPGAHLYFFKDAYLIVKGALIAKGNADSKIQLSPMENEWKGLYVVRATEPSALKYVTINKTTGLSDGILSLTGGVTFYQSEVNISNSIIDGTRAEDALNIVDSKFTLSNSKILNTHSDGFDSDFSTGMISDSTFSTIGGDAIDFSGGNNELKNVKIMNVHDKGVSAGEGSVLDLSSILMSKIGVGIAAKDGSTVVADDINIKDYQLHAAMSYVKKDFYGSPSIAIKRITHNGINPFSRQRGSRMTVDGQEIPQKDVNVKTLYSNEVMRK